MPKPVPSDTPRPTSRICDSPIASSPWPGGSNSSEAGPAKKSAPAPKPATARPVIRPFLSGNHFTAAAIGQT